MKIRREIGEKGQVVIPKDIREYLGLRKGERVIFEIVGKEVKISQERSAEEIVEDFVNIPKLKKRLNVKEMKKILEEQYDLP